MKKGKLHIYGVTGYIMPNNNVKPMLPTTKHLDTKKQPEHLNVEPTSVNENSSGVPPMLPIISKF